MNRSAEPGGSALAMGLIGAAHAVEARLEASLEPLGLSLAKFGVLARLVEAGDELPLSSLADRLACVRSNITQLVDRLEADGLVARSPDPEDRRSIRAQITKAGRSLHEEGAKALRAAEHAAFAHLPPQERRMLSRLVQGLRKGK